MTQTTIPIIGMDNVILPKNAVRMNESKLNLMKNTKRNVADTDLNNFTDKKGYTYSGNKYPQNRREENMTKKAIKTNTETDFILDKQEVERKINAASGNIPKVMELMLKMMLEERGHNHKEFRQKVLEALQNDKFNVENILDYDFGGKWKGDKLKKLWARYLFDTYTMLCTKIANNFIRYDGSSQNFVFKGKDDVSGSIRGTKGKARMHVNKLGAIDVLNDKRRITNILRDFFQGKKYLAERGNWYLPGAPVPDKVEYGTLINWLNLSISYFAGQLLSCRKYNVRDIMSIMNNMDTELSGILNEVDPDQEKDKRSSTIRQPWNKACNLKKCVQFLYSKCKFGNNVITGQFFSGKNSRSGKLKYKTILNNCISDLKNLKYQEEEEIA